MSEASGKTSPVEQVVNRTENANGCSSAWISIEDGEPSKEGHYLIRDEKGSFEVRLFKKYSTDSGYFISEFGCGSRMTHWMEIPELPEAG